MPQALDVHEDLPGKPVGATYRDVWHQQDVGISGDTIPLALNTHDSLLMVFDQVTQPGWWQPTSIAV